MTIATMNHYLRNLYLVKSDPTLMQSCIQIVDQHCKTLSEYNSSNGQSHHKNTPLTPPRVLWISESPPEAANFTHITPKHYRQILGQEFSLIIYDVAEGIRANPWYAVIGTLQLGGIMLLLSPTTEIADLPSALPMSYRALDKSCAEADRSHFNALFAALFSQYFANQVIDCPQQLHHCLDQWKQIQSERLTQTLPKSVQQQLSVAITEQIAIGKQLVHQLMAADIDRTSPSIHLLQADRGRGKSDLLGQLPTLLLQAYDAPADCRFTQIIYITHSNEASHTIRNGLYRFRDHLIGLENRTDNIGPVHIRFCSPDDPSLFTQASQQYNPHILLLVDEAAALPTYWLQQATAHYSTIVFATTTHGYENNGMGFSLSFLPTLAHYTSHQLTHPIRFLAQCPLEKFAEALLTPHHGNDTRIHLPDGLHILEHQQLLTQPTLRSSVMACLMEAHYQTAPDDLQRLLDAPDMQCGVFIQDSTLIGCIWIVTEGGINDQPLQQAIAQGRRRVNGHLSAQQLAYTYGDTSILTHHIWRINRIAVLPNYQHQGFGTQILAALHKLANTAQVDMITSAFGASERLLRFWQHNSYQIAKQGQKINSVTGLVNAIVLLPISDNANLQLVHEWHQVAQQWHTLLGKGAAIDDQLPLQSDSATAHAKKMLWEFINGSRSFDYTEIYLYWYMQTNTIKDEINTHGLAVQPSELLTQRYLQGNSLETLMVDYGLANKKALILACKAALVGGPPSTPNKPINTE